ncbi:VWA domain-containing protein (plasmid) [Salipiger sp. H15]|uniref:VWA domain-containing protein n=1 Tax=Alloyangia sp. H15 TaxID=3029062 RepID=A0AAU8ASJ8_9RHOB
MIELGPLVLMRPWWLAALPVLALATVLALRRADGLGAWRQVVDAELFAVLRRLGHVIEARPDPRPRWLGGAAALLSFGLAGPATRNADAPAFRNLDAVMILLDLSPSITEGGSLGAAQAAVSRVIDRHGTRPVALAVFASESFLVSVPVEDPEPLQSAIAVLDAGTMPVAGSRPDRALAMARDALRDAAAERPDVVLVSDGGAVGPEAQAIARDMAADGIRLSAVFVAPGAPPYGAPPPDRAALAALVAVGGGRLVEAGDTAALEALLQDRTGAGLAETARRTLLFEDHGRLLVALAFAAMLPLFRRRKAP